MRRRMPKFMRVGRGNPMRLTILVLLLAVPFTSSLLAQESRPPRRGGVAARVTDSKPPEAVQRQARMLGDKLDKPAKEKTTLTGTVVDGQGRPVKAKAILQRGFARLEGFTARGTLSFDRERPSRSNTREDDSLLETFTMDTTEGMLESLQHGAAASIQGLNVLEKETGRRYDVFEVVAPVRSSWDSPIRYKLYFFDSQTGFLARTQYSNGPKNSNVEVRFSDWRVVDGSAYPGRIERLEDGVSSFAFSVDEVAAAARGEAAEFR
jgi:hypothetical protein